MIFFILIIYSCLGAITVWSPNALYNVTIECSICAFGNPFIFPTYGRLHFYDIGSTCSISTALLSQNTYAILYNTPSNCDASDLVLSAQKINAIGVIFVLWNENLSVILIPKDKVSGSAITINAIVIRKTDGDKLKSYALNEIWVTYSLSSMPVASPQITYAMSSNYTLDKANINILSDMNTRFKFTVDQFIIVLCYSLPTDVGVSFYTDCGVNSQYPNYCLPGSASASGSQMLENSIKIINFFNTLSGQNAITEFFEFLLYLYSNCEFDYSANCIEQVFSYYSLSSSITSGWTSTAVQLEMIAPFFVLNHWDYFWPEYFEISYCLNSINPPSSCQTCTGGCSYQDLYNPSCSQACNVSQCGYDNLACLMVNNCYSFVNTCSNNLCSPGCSYSDMSAGLCPLACAGSCFANCASMYCSPECLWNDVNNRNCNSYCSPECNTICFNNTYCITGCKYSDMSPNYCPSHCTQDCCNSPQVSGNTTNICTSGCYFSDMAQGLCPLACTGSCFKYCSTVYCSPQCLISDLQNGYCNASCTPECMKSTCSTPELYCSPGCKFSDITNSYCPVACTSNCCDNHNQTNNNSNICAAGCYFSDMSAGLCPLECKGPCFNNCSSKYCSPDCLQSDVNIGNCSAVCSLDCKSQCSRVPEYCNSECKYSDMNLGLCPLTCTGTCFKNCSLNYCSPDCLWTDVNNGNCSSHCSSDCMGWCRNRIEYCSRGCLWSDLDNGICDSECTPECKAHCQQKGNNSPNLSVIIIVTVVVIVVSAM